MKITQSSKYNFIKQQIYKYKFMLIKEPKGFYFSPKDWEDIFIHSFLSTMLSLSTHKLFLF